MQEPSDILLRQFVLGALDEPRRLEVEQQLITDPATFDALELVEEELAEAYVEDGLPDADRQGFERHYLCTPERRRQVAFLRQLRNRAAAGVAESKVRPFERRSVWRLTPAWTGALAASLCVAVGLSGWLGARESSLRQQMQALGADRAVQEQAARQLLSEVNRLSARTSQLESTMVGAQVAVPDPSALPLATVPALTPLVELSAMVLRDAGAPTAVAIPPNASLVHFRLVLRGPAFAAYRAIFYSGTGDELWSVSRLRADASPTSPAVIAVAPSELLPPGDYEIRVRGVTAAGREEPVATYTFRRPS